MKRYSAATSAMIPLFYNKTLSYRIASLINNSSIRFHHIDITI